jgi:hypothetical protein
LRLRVLPTELVRAGPGLSDLQPVLGRFEIAGDALYFVSRFPFIAGRSYSLLVNSEDDGDSVEVWTIERPTDAAVSTTEIVAIYPSAGELPLNQLKLYVHFSSPMSEGWANRAVHVRRADTNESIEDVFLQMEPELWDPDRRRLTLLLDPGRIKRGLNPHEEVGYPLIEGVPIVVTVDAAFHDWAGRRLRAAAERRYDVGPAVRARVDPKRWRFDCPPAGSIEPLIVTFDRPLDHALLDHCLSVTNESGVTVAGQAAIGAAERSWTFEPGSPWQAGCYQLIVEPRLEDLAGNSLLRVFDRDLTRAEDAPVETSTTSIDFECASPASRLHRLAE